MGLKEKIFLGYLRTKFNLLSILSKKKAAEAAVKLFTTPQIRVQKELPPVFTEANQVDLGFYDYKIKGYCWNPGADKKMLILHGFESTSLNFAQYVMPVVEKGFAVYAFDAPAHGRSSGETVNAMVYRDFILTVNEKFGPFKFFICHSFGGLALSLALEEIPHDETFRVVFIAPATETTTAVDQLFQLFRLRPSLRVAFEEYIKEKGGHGSAWFSVNRASDNIHANLLWVHDRDDDMTPLSDVKPIMNKKFPNFEFHITEGLGHRRIYRDKNVVEKIVNFITG
jgi:pimeloyl-ACP methyl ester carboxylesterase